MSEPEKPGSGSADRHKETRLEQRVAVARFGLVLLLLLVTFVFLASEPTGSLGPVRRGRAPGGDVARGARRLRGQPDASGGSR